MIRALTGFSTRNPWKVIALWAVLGIALTMLGQAFVFRATQTGNGGFLPAQYDSAAALKIAEEHFGADPDANPLTVLVARSDGSPLAAADEARIDAEAARLAGTRVVMPRNEDAPPFVQDHSQVPRISPAMTAPDRSFRLLTAELTGNPADPGVQDTYRAFRDSVREGFAREGLRTGFTGGLADSVDTVDAEETRTMVVGILMLGAIVLLHVLVFRSVLAALLPLLAVSVIGGAAAGVVVCAALLTGTGLADSTPGLINVVLVGIGIDYFLFLLFRFREHLRRHPEQSGREAAAAVAGRVGTAITSAALTIVAAFATLGVASFGQFRVLGPAIALSVLVMLLGSLTFMPALLAVSGRKMFWPSRALKREPRRAPPHGWARWWHSGRSRWPSHRWCCSAGWPRGCWGCGWTTGRAVRVGSVPPRRQPRPRSRARCRPGCRTRPACSSRRTTVPRSAPGGWTGCPGRSPRSAVWAGSRTRC